MGINILWRRGFIYLHRIDVWGLKFTNDSQQLNMSSLSNSSYVVRSELVRTMYGWRWHWLGTVLEWLRQKWGNV